MHKFRSIASLRPNSRRESQQKYFQKHAVKITSYNSARYKQQVLAEREIPDGLASPAPKFPPVPKVAVRMKKQAEREAKRKANEEATILSRGRGPTRARTGPAWRTRACSTSAADHVFDPERPESEEKAANTGEAKARATVNTSYESWRQESMLTHTMFN